MSIPSGHYKWYQSLSPAPISTTSSDSFPSLEPPMFSGDSDSSSWLEGCVGYLRVSKVHIDEMVDETGWFLENETYFWFLDWQKNRIAIPWEFIPGLLFLPLGVICSMLCRPPEFGLSSEFKHRLCGVGSCSKLVKFRPRMFEFCFGFKRGGYVEFKLWGDELPIWELISGLLLLLLDVNCSMFPGKFGLCYGFKGNGNWVIRLVRKQRKLVQPLVMW
ncbi:hypothetical protein LINGRAHAP2_LOCUS7258 [Linum grandiflorum]